MFKKPIKSLVRKMVKNPVAVEVIADKADKAIAKELDKRTGGLASKIDKVV